MIKPEKIAAIVAIVQLFKYYGTPHKLLPFFAVLMGVALEYSDNPSPQGILDGLIMGAMTTGSYGVLKGASQTVLKRQKPVGGPVARSDDPVGRVGPIEDLDDDHSFKS